MAYIPIASCLSQLVPVALVFANSIMKLLIVLVNIASFSLQLDSLFNSSSSHEIKLRIISEIKNENLIFFLLTLVLDWLFVLVESI